MNYYLPLQREKDGKPTGVWDYCCQNDRTGTYPVGYCAGWHELTLEEFEKRFPDQGEHFFKDQEARRPFRASYHRGGHKSEAEAFACYRRYELDLHVRVTTTPDTYRPCMVCEELTNRLVTVHNSERFHICAKHDDRKFLEERYRSGTKRGSY